jgi:imidazolonepropionase-like amidohydrolase
MAVGSDVGPFPHVTQARELELMVHFGMKPTAVLQADLLNGAKLLMWEGKIGELKAGYYADVIAVAGEPDRGYLCGDEGKVRHEGWHNLRTLIFLCSDRWL